MRSTIAVTRAGRPGAVPVTARLTRGGGGAARLRALLDSGQTIVAPGAYDALSARLIEEAGFPAVYMTGFGTAASLLGRPDIGLLIRQRDGRQRPPDQRLRRGAGHRRRRYRLREPDERDPHRRDYERAGVAGIHLEDQVMPKRCGHLSGKTLVPVGEMTAKVQAAVAARTDPDFVIIARTDARAVEGWDAPSNGRPATSRPGPTFCSWRRRRTRRKSTHRPDVRRRPAAVQLGGGRAHPAGEPGPAGRARVPDRHLPDRGAARGRHRGAVILAALHATAPRPPCGRLPDASPSLSTRSAWPRCATSKPDSATSPTQPT